jgi:hypothetical protein
VLNGLVAVERDRRHPGVDAELLVDDLEVLAPEAYRVSEASEPLIRELDHRAAAAAPDRFGRGEHAAVGKELEPGRGSDLTPVYELVSARQ